MAHSWINIDALGALQHTSSKGDLAIQGEGFFLVKKDGDDKLGYMRTGSFQPDKEGYLVTPFGQKLQGWKSAEGSAGASSAADLEAVQIKRAGVATAAGIVPVEESSDTAYATTQIEINVALQRGAEYSDSYVPYDTIRQPLIDAHNASEINLETMEQIRPFDASRSALSDYWSMMQEIARDFQLVYDSGGTDNWVNGRFNNLNDFASAVASTVSTIKNRYDGGTVSIYDDKGQEHTLELSYYKWNDTNWGIYVNKVDGKWNNYFGYNSSVPLLARVSGASNDNTIIDCSFNGEGTFTEYWYSGRTAPCTLDITLEDGTTFTTQVDVRGLHVSDTGPFYSASDILQNGHAKPIPLTDWAITEDGGIDGFYANGTRQRLYTLPLGSTQDLSGVAMSEGNVFHPRKDLSMLTLHQAGTNGLGTVFTNALEGSTVDIAQQLSDMVKTQHAYSANTRAIATTSEMLDMLERI
jgi:flagellar hook protein FlgE